eukprot:scaffold12781_cov13-Prasinocladus_malaysianus.AAC.2
MLGLELERREGVEVDGSAWIGIGEVGGGDVTVSGSSVIDGSGCIGMGVWVVAAAPCGGRSGRMAGVSGSAAANSSSKSDEVANICWDMMSGWVLVGKEEIDRQLRRHKMAVTPVLVEAGTPALNNSASGSVSDEVVPGDSPYPIKNSEMAVSWSLDFERSPGVRSKGSGILAGRTGGHAYVPVSSWYRAPRTEGW